MDRISPERRSENMSRIRSKNTKPEMRVRSLLHNAGYRFSLHRKDLPGTPDIVLPKYKSIIQVRGCYWHRHHGCEKTTNPKQNSEFWQKKFDVNVQRDIRTDKALKELGWNVIVVWGCELADEKKLISKLTDLLQI